MTRPLRCPALLLGLLLCTVFRVQAHEDGSGKTVSNTTFSLYYRAVSAGNTFTSIEEGHIRTLDKDYFLHHLGISFSKDFYFSFLPENTFLSAGLKLYETHYSGAEFTANLPGYDSTVPGARLPASYNRLVVPVYFGSTIRFIPGNRAHLNVFAGFSAGIASVSGTELSAGGNEATSSQNLSWEERDNVTYGNSGVSAFYASVDAGFRGTPFNFPNLTIGATASFDLTRTPAVEINGTWFNNSLGVTDSYHYRYSRKYINLLLSLNYTFGKRWKRMLANE